MLLAASKRWPALLLTAVLSAFLLLFLSVAIAEGLLNPVAVLAALIPWVILWHVQRSDTRCPACKKVSALRARTFAEDPGFRCRFCGHHHDPETDLDASPLAGGYPPARGLEKIITLFAMSFALAMMLVNTLVGESGLFMLIPSVMLVIGCARLYGWVPLGSGSGGGGAGGGGAGGGGGGGGC